ncbi:sulfite exporter TauE/SafE family protein [Enterocloster aldenensis]|uniref:sulfite exporter TauE/SafE family protein n=1 Tax=Enterocloster aldenensis TaxID=358742 RepID=UPI000E52A008|nr:sulfite exporter TauE/SafE family protein [Enterocloster aldenensis]
MGYAVFFLVILLSNIIQGITGFAGTILAMPPSLMLVGYDTAKPVLNVLGLLSGIYVFAGHRKHVCWGELKKIVAVMAAGIVGGIFLKGFFAGRERVLYALLGLFVVCLSLQGLHKLWRDWLGTQEDAAAGAEAAAEAKAAAGAKTAEAKAAAEGKAAGPDKAGLYLLLGLAGIVHGIFVSGGPLLIGYLTKRIQDKVSFRATISTVWVVLNTIILLDDIRSGLWNPELVKIQAASIPFLLAGMAVGSRLYAKMSQRLFMLITYVLLFVSGISLLIK